MIVDNNLAFFLFLQALVYTGLGRLEEAVQILRSIIEIDQPDTIARGGEVFVNTVSEHSFLFVYTLN